MKVPRPLIHNLCFYDQTAEKTASLTFEYDEEKVRKEMTLTVDMVQRNDVRVQRTQADEVCILQGKVTMLYLKSENQNLFDAWYERNKPVSVLTKKA